MSNQSRGTIDGAWLKLALKACGESQASAARRMNRPRNFFQKHIKTGVYLNAESLADLCRAMPQINVRFILTGEGEPLLEP